MFQHPSPKAASEVKKQIRSPKYQDSLHYEDSLENSTEMQMQISHSKKKIIY